MELLKSYNQSKFDNKQKKNKNALTEADIKLYKESDNLCLFGEYKLNYGNDEEKRSITFIHKISINIIDGDVSSYYEIKNNNLTNDRIFKNSVIVKKNNFNKILDSIETGFIKGEKRKNFWGVKYEKAIEDIFLTFQNTLKERFTSSFYKDKNFDYANGYPAIYEIIVDFHLDKKGIKGHDNIYNDIQYEYPKKKWLKLNDYKFLPAVLDEYNIKSKYLIKELNTANQNLQISAINYICKLFGENYIDYLKLIPWQIHCAFKPNNKRTHTLKNESEKNFMVCVMQNWEKQNIKFDSLVSTVNKLLSIRYELENKGLELKFKAKNDSDFDTLLEIWMGHKKHLARGYRLKYNFPNEFVQFIEEEIIDENSQVYYPKILKSEEDFMIEGYEMRNCMSKQFIHAFSSIYISLRNNRTKINLQYRKGALVQSYGKANTPVKIKFDNAIKILNSKISKFPDIVGIKEKYDVINN